MGEINLMNMLINDVIYNIISFLNNYGKIMFLSVTKNTHILKDRIYYDDVIDIDKILILWYYDRFTNVRTDVIPLKFPKLITHMVFYPSYGKYVNLKDRIPNSVTHLTFGYYFNQDIKDCIPNSVTHLTFGAFFNQDIKECIPNSVTHLTFGVSFNQDIKEYIPYSVTHLTFGINFNKDIKECIPNSVTHLTFGSKFNKDIKDCIPTSITHL